MSGFAAVVDLTGRGTARWLAGHPWIFRSDLATRDGPPAGAVVSVHGDRGQSLGQAFWSARSKIALRRLTTGDAPVDDDLFRRRIEGAIRLRGVLLPGENACRLVHGDADGLPGLVVDRYGDYLSIQLLIPGMESRRELIIRSLVDLTGCRGIMNRSATTARELEGLPAETGVVHGEVPEPVLIREGQLTLAVSLHKGQKTGGFLDQRENHLLAGRYARGRALDCFSYVGGFALQMARRATRVTAVDSSAGACEQIHANVARNVLTNVDVVCANVFDHLRAAVDAGERYGTIVLDPPAFAKTRAARAAGLRGYREINLQALKLLEPGGYLLTGSCSHHVDEADFEAMLQAAAADAGREVQILERRGAGRDHPVLLGLQETRYLKFYVLRVL
jgi:23S rRNA (cytosine1962-C5)-methyltransferase